MMLRTGSRRLVRGAVKRLRNVAEQMVNGNEISLVMIMVNMVIMGSTLFLLLFGSAEH